jgi:CheY-like chemotaxis protein
MSRALQQVGYQVVSVMNGREGLSRVISERPDCLVLDVVLPDMNGYEICRHIRSLAAFKQLPIIMVSTKKTSLDASWALRQGVSRYLPKPFSQEALCNAVQELIGSQGSSTPTPPSVVPKSPPARSFPIEQSPSSPLLQSLIPLRIQGQEPLQSQNLGSALISDHLARRVYSMVDGRSNIERLCLLTRMSLEQMRSVLRLLIEQHRIQLYTPAGQRVDATLFFRDS